MQLAGQHKAWNMKNANNILVGSLKERYHSEDPGVDRRIILKGPFGNMMV